MKKIFTLLIILTSLSPKPQTLEVSTNIYEGTTTTDSLWFTHDEYVNYVFYNLYMQEAETTYNNKFNL